MELLSPKGMLINESGKQAARLISGLNGQLSYLSAYFFTIVAHIFNKVRLYVREWMCNNGDN